MAKALPLKLWLALEDSVAEHKAAIAQNFAEARARLLPPLPEPRAVAWDWQGYVYTLGMNADGSPRIDVTGPPEGPWEELTGMRPLW